jgi:putative ABC transport system permease protein
MGEFRKHPGRAVLTLLSVVIGVASVVAVSFAMITTRTAYKSMYQAVSGKAALEVTATAGEGFDRNVLETVRQVAGVRVAVPVIQRPMKLIVEGQNIRAIGLGIDPATDSAVRDYELTSGKFFDNGSGLVLDSGFADSLNAKVDTPVTIMARRKAKTKVAGLVRPTGISSAASGPIVMMPIDDAERRFQTRGKIDSVQIVLEDDANEDEVVASIAKALPSGLDIHTPSLRSRTAEETMNAIEHGLRMSRYFSLVAAVFIIMNTFLMSVSERRKQLSIMRAIGATRRQTATLLVREAVFMGVTGTIIGSVLGVVAAHFLNGAMGNLFQAKLPPLAMVWTPFAWGLGCGLGISLIGVIIPAWRTWQLTPIEGMRPVVQQDSSQPSILVPLLGFVVIGVSAALLMACRNALLPMWFSVPASLVGLLGIVMLVPAVIPAMAGASAALVKPFARVEAQLARLQLLRHRGRTTLTIGVLFVAFSTGIGLACTIMDNVEDVRNWYRTAIVGDYFVRIQMPDMVGGVAPQLPEEVRAEIEAIPGIRSLDTYRFTKITANGEAGAIAVARTFPTPENVNFDVKDQTLTKAELRDALHRGEVIVGSVLAQRAGVKPGDDLTIETIDGPRKLKVAAVANDYMSGGLAVNIQRDYAKKYLDIDGVDAFIVKAESDQREAVGVALKDIAAKHELLFQSYSDLINLIDRMMAGLVGSLWVLLVLGFIVAAFGMVNTLTMNVLEQTRELGLLRIVGMTRAQVRRSIIAQATMMAILAIIPGILAGVLLAWIINVATLPVTGHPVEFVLRPGMVAGAVVVAFIVVLIAAWTPAERAARLTLTKALRYD